MTTVVLTTGKVLPQYFDKFLEQLKDIPHKIASIWDNEDPKYVERLAAHNFKIVTSDHTQMPIIHAQNITIVKGVTTANELGYDYILRTRFDIVCNDMPKYLELSAPLYREKLTVLCGVGDYFLDIVVAGRTEDMVNTYKTHRVDDGRTIEKFLMDQYSGRSTHTREEIRTMFHFSLPLCRENGIEFVFFKKPDWIAPNRTIPDMLVISQYCNESHCWI
jgi:hypothetical protein